MHQLILSHQMMPICVFAVYFSCDHFFHFSFFAAKRTKVVIVYTKFHIKNAKFLFFKFTSLLLQSKPVQQICLHFFNMKKKKKTSLILGVSETNRTKCFYFQSSIRNLAFCIRQWWLNKKCQKNHYLRLATMSWFISWYLASQWRRWRFF